MYPIGFEEVVKKHGTTEKFLSRYYRVAPRTVRFWNALLRAQDKPFQPSKTLIVCDPHTYYEDDDLVRFIYLNKFIKDWKPDVFILNGDLENLDSISKYNEDQNLTKENFRFRYEKDIYAANRALDLILKDIDKNIVKIFIEGNHEDRIHRYVEKRPEMSGFVDLVKDFRINERFNEFVPYRKFYHIQDIMVTHAVMNKKKTPIGGVYATKTILEKCSKSIVYGHTHEKDCRELKRFGAPVIYGVCGGCFFRHTHKYSEDTPRAEWAGIVLVEHTNPDHSEFNFKSLMELESMYS